MKDKQIIIDGCDVSGCGWYTQGATGMICADWHISNDCSKNPNCHYKQLKRKEQECKSLRNLLAEHNNVMKINELMMKEFGIEILKDITTGDITLRSIKLIELKQECEELKDKIKFMEEYIKTVENTRDELEIKNKRLKLDLIEAKAQGDYLNNLALSETLNLVSEQLDQLKQVLTEVKEITQGVRNYLQVPHPRDVRYEMDIILQKISECEVEDER